MSVLGIDVFRATPYIYQFHATGQVYHAWYEISSILNGESLFIEMRQTDNKIVHVLDYIVKSDSTNIEVEAYKGVSFTPGNVRMNWQSYNQKIQKPPSLELYQNPTVPNLDGAESTFKLKGYGPAQGGQTSFSSIASNIPLEDMLEANTDYLIEIKNNGTQAREFFLHVVWYESGN